ncbi:hypothetical protein Catovirus_1_311 [Catovirus CTV1]|uniref:Uncharacterized protein n=1 Tax=Catovirus CTV1 TaxID=1977631 RepID=A0A1V0S997_9VIRU|nr:hypothetical protein Catovirus_1_311 [Catovirus CTV1]
MSSESASFRNEQTQDFNAAFQADIWLMVIGAIILTASFLWKDILTDILDYYLPKAFNNNLLKRILFTFIVTVALIALAIYLRDQLRKLNNRINDNNIPIGNLIDN